MKKQREIFKGEIYWSSQPFVKGHLQKGSRPYLVVSSRNSRGYVTVLPITSKIKRITNRDNILVKGKHNQVLVDQPQTVPVSTLGRYLDRITPDEVDGILERMLEFFDYLLTDKDEDFWVSIL